MKAEIKLIDIKKLEIYIEIILRNSKIQYKKRSSIRCLEYLKQNYTVYKGIQIQK